VSSPISQFRRRSARTVFVLSGGGNQAVSQVGMLRALLERGITPDAVIGASAGAFNGAVIAAWPNPEGVERLVDIWLSLRGEGVFPNGRLSRAWNLLKRDDHLFSNQGLRDVIAQAPELESFEKLAVPLRVIATDLDTGDEVVLAGGPLEPALLASAALPGLFPPVRHDGRRLVDGAVVDAVPLSHALAGPVDRVYVLNVTGELMKRPIRSPIDVAVRAFTISRNQRFELELRNAPPGVEVVVLPGPADDRDLVDFSGAEVLIEEAHHLTAKALDVRAARRRGPARRTWWPRRAG